MEEQVRIILEVYNRYRLALRDGDESLQKRLFRMIDDLEWLLPEAAAEIEKRYPVNK